MPTAEANTRRNGDAVRMSVLPELPATLPHEMRKELTWVDYSNPVNPLGTPRVLIQAFHMALVDGDLNYRPDRSGYSLRRILAAYHEIPIESILVGTSTTSLVRSIVQSLEGDVVTASVPCAIDTELAVANAGCSFQPMPNPFSFATCKFPIAVHDVGRMETVLLANPGYPTSRLLSREILLEYLENCKWVVVDESLLELSLGGESFIPLTQRYRNLIIVRNPSATFAAPGEPVSYAVAHPDTIAKIMPFTDPNGIGMAAEVMASVIPQMMGYLDRSHDFLEREIPWLQCMLSLIPGIRIFPSEANYVLCRFDDQGMELGVKDANELSIRLQLTGLLVPQLTRISGLKDQESYFCIASQTHAGNQKLIEAMKKIVRG